MIRSVFAFSMTLVAASASLRAEEARAEAPVAPYELKNRSSFTLPADTRTPFWPIGWVRPSNAPATPRVTIQPTGPRFQIQPQHFTVQSILLGNPPFATINGRAFGEGELLPVWIGDKPLRVVVKGIRESGVFLENDGNQIFVPVKRDVLQPKAADQKQGSEFKINILPDKSEK